MDLNDEWNKMEVMMKKECCEFVTLMLCRFLCIINEEICTSYKFSICLYFE